METLETQKNTWKIKIDDYYGPLDALLKIIDKNKMTILKIDINKITNQYCDYVDELIAKALSQKELDELSDYLYIAHHLISLKARYLIQEQNRLNNIEDNFDWSEEALAKLLVLVQKYKEAMVNLSQKQSERLLMFTKHSEPFEKYLPADFNFEKLPDHLSSSIFLKYLEEFNELEEENLISVSEYEIFDISTLEVQERILKYLQRKKIPVYFSTMFKDFYQEEKFQRFYLVTLFIAGLTLANENKISLYDQDNEIILELK